MQKASYRKLLKLGLSTLPLTYALMGVPMAQADDYSNIVDLQVDRSPSPWDPSLTGLPVYKNSSALEKSIASWLALQNPKELPPISFVDQFLTQHKDWPHLSSIRRMYEQHLVTERKTVKHYPQHAQIEAFFSKHPPLTDKGKLLYLKSAIRAGHGEKATSLIQSYWRQGYFNSSLEHDVFKTYQEALSPEIHYDRANSLLFSKKTQSALALIPYMHKADAKEIKVRAKLILGQKGVDTALAKLSPKQQKSSGVTFDRIRWRYKKGYLTSAAKLLEETSAQTMQDNSRKWFEMRYLLSRELLSAKKYKEAYNLISQRKSDNRYDIAEGEFLAGWLALDFINDPKQAYIHFTKLYHNVSTAQSKSRGAFWAGFAAQKAKMDPYLMRDWHEKAAQYSSSFYGQLSRDWLYYQTEDEKYYLPPATELKIGTVTFSTPLLNDFAKAAEILNNYPETQKEAGIFLRALYLDSTSAEDKHAALGYATQFNRPEIATYLSRKHYAKTGTTLALGYPDISATDLPKGANQALLSAIVRQESNFDPNAMSPAGARGLAQLMPRTATWMAKKHNKKHRTSWLTSKPKHNLDIGWDYLDYLLKMRDGNHILVAASYNAGPGNVNKWIRANGDPRSDKVNILQWIESIPVSETRNYVQRILENEQQYLTNIEGKPRPITLAEKMGLTFAKVDLPPMIKPTRKPAPNAVTPKTKPIIAEKEQKSSQDKIRSAQRQVSVRPIL